MRFVNVIRQWLTFWTTLYIHSGVDPPGTLHILTLALTPLLFILPYLSQFSTSGAQERHGQVCLGQLPYQQNYHRFASPIFLNCINCIL